MQSLPPPRSFFGPEGDLARVLGADGFEERPQQLAMVDAVEASLSSGRHALVEAGTGVGKSFGYLVPLLLWAAAHEKRVAVSTSTIALQEQLMGKDIPRLAEALPFDVRAALVKGRGNYICLRRLRNAHGDAPMLFAVDEAREQLEAILSWSTQTQTGTRQDLGFQPSGDVWDAVRAEPGNCLGRNCPHYARCHYQRSRREAQEARLLVLNHHVLLADLALRRSGGSFLPKVDAIVIDEAHDLEDVAAEHLGTRVTVRGAMRTLGRLWSPSRKRGLLARDFPQRLRDDVKSLRRRVGAFFDAVTEDARDASAAAGGERTLSIPNDAQFANPLSEPLRNLGRDLRDTAPDVGDDERVMEIVSRARGLGELADALDSLLEPGEVGYVRWAEVGDGGRTALHRAPVEVGDLLGPVLWDKHHSVILTSATLTTGAPPSFAYMRARLGLADADAHAVGSPFAYDQQAVLRLYTRLPDPGRQGLAWEQSLPEAILDALADCRGGALVLFTSYGALRRAFERLRGRLEALGFEPLAQGAGVARSVLLDRLRQGGVVLFGVSSFWQGVDVPGDALTHVVITRLPFEVPSHPLHVARRALAERRGRDPFRELSLPQAALKLKQGFGRLIRRSTDRGVVAILDSRVRTRRYGRQLIDGLPPARVEVVDR